MTRSPNRRQFLQASALAATSLAGSNLGCYTEPQGRLEELTFHAAKKPVLVDTHVHCFAGDRDERFPYHPLGTYRPAEPATPEMLLESMNAAGVEYAIIVHPEPYQDDHRYLAHCLEVGGGRLKGTLLLFADRPGSLEKLPELVKKLPVVALRVHAYQADRLPPFGQPELRTLWQAAADHDLAVQLHFEPKYGIEFEPMIRDFQDTTVIIDHLGRPLQGTREEHDKILAWSKYDNTVLKISSLPKEEETPRDELQPIVERCAKAFGPERLIYGGGFNGAETTGESYRAAFQQARDLLADSFTWEEREQIFGGNAVRLFSLGK